MRALLSLVPLLGCGLMMAACMALMGRGHKKPTAPSDEQQIAALRAEVAELRREHDRG